MNPDAPHYHGHRQRLRQRFLESGFAGMAEHEVVELSLTLAIPRKDVKKPVKYRTSHRISTGHDETP